MRSPYISPRELAKMTGDSAAIGARPADQAVALRVEPKVSTLRASILRAARGAPRNPIADALVSVTVTLLFITAAAIFTGA